MSSELAIAVARPIESDAEALASFIARHSPESGQNGMPHFGISRKANPGEIAENSLARWNRRLDEPNWGRCWLLWSSGPRSVVGHCELRGGRAAAELHRAVLGMGILQAHTHQGWGTRLVAEAIAWARARDLAWIDLGVFENNLPARGLYKKMGFVEVGARSDAFHLEDGTVITDIHMALDLRRAR